MYLTKEDSLQIYTYKNISIVLFSIFFHTNSNVIIKTSKKKKFLKYELRLKKITFSIPTFISFSI